MGFEGACAVEEGFGSVGVVEGAMSPGEGEEGVGVVVDPRGGALEERKRVGGGAAGDEQGAGVASEDPIVGDGGDRALVECVEGGEGFGAREERVRGLGTALPGLKTIVVVDLGGERRRAEAVDEFERDHRLFVRCIGEPDTSFVVGERLAGGRGDELAAGEIG